MLHLIKPFLHLIKPFLHLIKPFLLLLDFFIVVFASFLFYLFDFVSNGAAHLAMMRLHCGTNAKTSELFASIYRLVEGRRRCQAVTGLLGKLSIADQASIVSDLKENGFYVFKNKLPPELCDAIEQFARVTPAILEGRGREFENLRVFDPTNPQSKTYRLQEPNIAQNPSMQRLMADPSMLAVAEGYIGATPMLSGLYLWWSATYGVEPGDHAAQLFHFDFDPSPKWLLYFVYLTDVGSENGPHVFVKGSHKAGHPAAKDLLKRGYVRIPDDEIMHAFGAGNVIEIHGGRGTVIAVDTRGFHKGKVLSAGHRLMAQLTYSFPIFCSANDGLEPLSGIVAPDLLAAADATPKVFSRYLPNR